MSFLLMVVVLIVTCALLCMIDADPAVAAQEEDLGFVYDRYGRLIGVNWHVLLKREFFRDYVIVTLGGRRYYRYVKGYYKELPDADIKRLLMRYLHNFKANSWTRGLESECMAILPLVCSQAEKLKDSSGYLNLRNGLFNLATGELEPHDSGVFSTSQLPIDYKFGAKCPRFRDFLDDVFMGDKELITLIGEVMGYCISDKTDAQAFFLFYSEGSSGKSTLADILIALAGGEKNVSSVSMAGLNQKFSRSQLHDKLLNICTEADTSNGFETPTIKAIASGDPIQLESKGKDPLTCRIKAKLVFSVNTLPFPKDKTYAFVRRIVIVPFLARFVDRPQSPNELEIDRGIKDRLMAELPGILNFAIGGLKRLVRNGYKFSESKRAAKLLAAYRRDVHPLFDFSKSCIVAAGGERISINVLYEAFRTWCVQQGHARSASLTFRHFLREFRTLLTSEHIPFSMRKSNGTRFIEGITWTDAGLRLRLRDTTIQNL